MKKRTIFAVILLILLSSITIKDVITISKFNLKKINIENNFLIEEKELRKLLDPIYNKNLIFLNNLEIEQLLMNNNFIKSFYIKKKYPDTLEIKIIEKKPIAILFFDKKKFYLSENIELIDFKKLKDYENLPYIFGNIEEFKVIFNNLKRIDFPISLVKKFILFEINRWDLETYDNKVIKLPTNNYIESLENYLKLMNKDIFNKYKLFDYRISNQLILK
jgi:cell division protein FtsQ